MSDELLSLLARSVENPAARTPIQPASAGAGEKAVRTTDIVDGISLRHGEPAPSISPDRQAWLNERRKGIGGSEIAAILGLDPFRGALDIFLGKVEGYDAPETEDMLRGQVLEPGIINWYSRRLLVTAVPNATSYQHPTRPVCRCTPDAMTAATDAEIPRLVSVKCPRRGGDAWGDYDGSTRFPQHMALQLQYEWAVLTAYGFRLDPLMHLAAMVDGDLRIYHCEADTELQAVLLEQAEQWWERHVVAKVPPDLDGSDGARAWIKRRFPTSNGTTRTATAAEEALLLELGETAKAVEVAETAYETARRRVEQAIGVDAGIRGASATITWRARRDGVRVFKKSFNWESK